MSARVARTRKSLVEKYPRLIEVAKKNPDLTLKDLHERFGIAAETIRKTLAEAGVVLDLQRNPRKRSAP